MKDGLQYADDASRMMVERANSSHIETIWDRYEKMQPQCGFGTLGICCRNCSMGPCRIDPFGDGSQKGICGANADTIAARNLVRMIAGGAAAHSDHGRDIAHTLLMVSEDTESDYVVKDDNKLRAVAPPVLARRPLYYYATSVATIVFCWGVGVLARIVGL